MKATLSEAKDKLTITIPVEPAKSGSGKTLVLATTRGNIRTGLEYEHEGYKPDVFLGVNAFIFPKAKDK